MLRLMLMLIWAHLMLLSGSAGARHRQGWQVASWPRVVLPAFLAAGFLASWPRHVLPLASFAAGLMLLCGCNKSACSGFASTDLAR